MAVSTRKRFEVFKRDAFTCQYCGRKPPDVVLHVDHILASAAGGDDDTDNLITSCAQCNLGKSDRPLNVCPPSFPSAEEIKERSEQLTAYNEYRRDVDRGRRLLHDDAETVMENARWDSYVSCGYDSDTLDLPSLTPSEKATARRFIDAIGRDGMSAAYDATVIFAGRTRRPQAALRYFCGCCWNMIKDAKE